MQAEADRSAPSGEQRAANGESWGGAEESGAIGAREIVKLERRVSGERAAAL